MEAKLISVEASAIAPGIGQVLGEVLFRVVASDPPLPKKLMELPPGHPGQLTRLAQGEHIPLV